MTGARWAKAALLGCTMALGLGAGADAEEVKVGILLGFTGPVESLTPGMAASGELAMKEANEAGLLDGVTLVPVQADSTCVDASAATAAAERLVTSEQVKAIVGAACSGVTTAFVNNVAVPNGIVVISPSATSPALTTIEDDGLFFRTAPSDARQGQVLAEAVRERGINSVAITYTNNDYGKGLSDAFTTAFEEAGGKVAMVAAHEDGKADYSAEVGALAASGADELAVFGYVDQGGKGIIQAALDAGAFERFVLADGMVAQPLIDNFGEDLEGSFGTLPGSGSESGPRFLDVAKAGGVDGDGPYRGETYDAVALIALAMQAAGSTDPAAFKGAVLDIANAPGETIGPGEIAKGIRILKDGGEVDYVGATDVEFSEVGEASGSYREVEVSGGAYETKTVR